MGNKARAIHRPEMANEMDKIQSQNVDTDIAKLVAENAKINPDFRFHAITMLAGLVVAFSSIQKLFA